MENFVKSIFENLCSNGFPHKKVSLPTLKMYEVADKKELSLNEALELLATTYELSFNIGDEKIIFEKNQAPISKDTNDSEQKEMFKQAQDFISGMDPVELKQMQDMIMSMSEDEKSELMEKGKEMGLFNS
jgi:hypothetical protein